MKEIKTTKTGMVYIEIDDYPTFNDMNRAYIPSLSLCPTLTTQMAHAKPPLVVIVKSDE